MTDDYDSPWKDILERYFSPFMAFFFPGAHADIDWSRGYESLDTELQQIVRDAELGKRLADKLVKVWRRSGAEQIVLVHIEVQGETDTAFVERMFVYHYRLYDRYRQPIVSLAVLGDDTPSWRPERYATELWGCETLLRFPIVKLTDYTQRFYLPDELARPFTQQLIEYEAAMSTPYITSVERQGIEKGVLQGLQAERALLVRQVQRRFDATTAEQLAGLLQAIDNPDQLADIGEWLIESKTGAILIKRVEELAKNG